MSNNFVRFQKTSFLLDARAFLEFLEMLSLQQ
jgi:hypothetical protein